MSYYTLSIVKVALLLFCAIQGVELTCVNEKPASCKIILQPDFDEKEFRNSVQIISSPVINATYYAGQTVAVSFKINSSSLEMDIHAYVDGCENIDYCTLLREGDGVLVKTCTFENVSMADNGKEIQFYMLLTFMEPIPGQLCHEPPTYLIVIDDLPSFAHWVDPSTGLHIAITSILPPLTNITVSLYYNNTVVTSHTTDTAGTNITFPPSLLTNHTGVFTIEATPVNIAGNGPSTNAILDLSEANYKLYYTLVNATVQTGFDYEFKGIINVKVDPYRLLTVPNLFHVSSSCSNGLVLTHVVDMQHFTASQSPQEYHILSITVPQLVYGGHNCSFTVMDEEGNTQTNDTGQSTYHTVSYKVDKDHNSFNVSCQFLPGSMADGCWIIVKNSHDNRIMNQTLFPLTHGNTKPASFGPYTAGIYTVLIYDHYNGTYNELRPVFMYDYIVILSPTTTTIAATSTTTTTVGMSSIASPSCSNANCDESSTDSNYNLIGGISAVAVIVALVVLIVVVIIVVVIVSKKLPLRRQGRYNVDGGGAVRVPEHDYEDEVEVQMPEVQVPKEPEVPEKHVLDLPQGNVGETTSENSADPLHFESSSPVINDPYNFVATTATENKESDTNYKDLNIMRPQTESHVCAQKPQDSLIVSGTNDLRRSSNRPSELKIHKYVVPGIKSESVGNSAETTFDSNNALLEDLNNDNQAQSSSPTFQISPPPTPTAMEQSYIPFGQVPGSYSRQGSNASTIVPSDEQLEPQRKPSLLSGNVMVYGSQASSLSLSQQSRNGSNDTLKDRGQLLVTTNPISSQQSNPLFKVEEDSEGYATTNQSTQDTSDVAGGMASSAGYVGHGHPRDTTTTTGGTDSSQAGETVGLIKQPRKK